MNGHRPVLSVFVFVSLLMVGCGGKDYSLQSVSGKVTSGGEPVPDLIVIFAPQATDSNLAPGPWSRGVTDANGVYTLQTRYNENGAVIGKHDVSFEYNDGNVEDLEELNEDLEEAMDEEDGSAEEAEQLKKQIAEMRKKLNSRPKVSENYTVTFDVTASGDNKADFELPGK